MKQKCPKCKIVYTNIDKAFSKKGIKADGSKRYQSWCKTCNKNNLKKDYTKNKQTYLQRNYKSQRNRYKYIKGLKQKAKCEKCGESHIACLDFHHIDPSTKIENIAFMAKYSYKKINEEIAKCIILCANCHRKLHYNEKTNKYPSAPAN